MILKKISDRDMRHCRFSKSPCDIGTPYQGPPGSPWVPPVGDKGAAHPGGNHSDNDMLMGLGRSLPWQPTTCPDDGMAGRSGGGVYAERGYIDQGWRGNWDFYETTPKKLRGKNEKDYLLPSGSEQQLHEVGSIAVWEYLGRNTSRSSLYSANREKID